MTQVRYAASRGLRSPRDGRVADSDDHFQHHGGMVRHRLHSDRTGAGLAQCEARSPGKYVETS